MDHESTVYDGQIIDSENGLSVESEPVVMDAQRARHLTDQIRQGLEITWNMIVEVYSGRAWKALGHTSWRDYCVKEFGNHHLAKALPRGERDELFVELREAGLSTRAIASATGASKSTVNRALSGESFDSSAVNEDSGVPNGTPDNPAPKVEGEDGKFYNASRPAARKSVSDVPEVLDGQSDINDALDEPITDFGIAPVDTDELLAKNARNRRLAARKLTGVGGHDQAPLPMVINLAGQVAITPAEADELDDEEVITLFEEGSRGVMVLAQLMKSLDPGSLDDLQTRREVRANLNSCQDLIDEVLTILEGK